MLPSAFVAIVDWLREDSTTKDTKDHEELTLLNPTRQALESPAR